MNSGARFSDSLINILPHGKELVLIEKLLYFDASSAKCLVRIPLLESFVPDDCGNVSSLIAIEIIAQGASVGQAKEWQKNEPTRIQPKVGMVIKVRDFSFPSPVIDTRKRLICVTSWTNSNSSVFEINGKVFYENNPEVALAEGYLLIATGNVDN